MNKKKEIFQNRTPEEIYKSVARDRRKRIGFWIFLAILLLIMGAISVYFIVLGNIDKMFK